MKNMKFMTGFAGLLLALWGLTGPFALAQHDHSTTTAKPKTEDVAFQVTGMHCLECADAIQQTMQKTPGVKNVRTSFKDKYACMRLDPTQTSVQKVAQAIANTPSPMPDSKFESALVLTVTGMKTEDDAETVENALDKVKGVKSVSIDQDNQQALVEFDKDGDAQLNQLTEATGAAGYNSTAWLPAKSKKAAGGGHHHGSGGGCMSSGGQSGGGCGH